jgi:hypothetical protein
VSSFAVSHCIVLGLSHEAVLGRVVGGSVEDVDPPVLEDAQFFGQQDGEEPPE